MCTLKLIYIDIECVVRLKDIIFDDLNTCKIKLEGVYSGLEIKEYPYEPPKELGISKEYECFANGELIGGIWL